MKHNDLENRALITLVESLDKEIDRLEIMNEKQFDNINILVDYINVQSNITFGGDGGVDLIYKNQTIQLKLKEWIIFIT